MEFPVLKASYLKNKYFYRISNWDWISKDEIFIVDSKSPRMITLDPWSQRIYLDASGQVTVEEYIHGLSELYAPNKIPPELDETVIDLLKKLVEEGLVQLADTPQVLNFQFIKPASDTTSIDLRGKWEGHYTYNLPKSVNAKLLGRVAFSINITNVLGEKFYGTVQDNLATGGTPGIGKIEGVLDGKNFHFEKMMPIHTGIDKKGQRFRDETRKHPVLVYKGIFLENTMTVQGTWKFKEKVTVKKWFIPIKVSAVNGHFEMGRVSESW